MKYTGRRQNDFSVHAEVCGPVDVAISAGGLARVAYMGLRCQNVSIAECADISCSTSAATLVGANSHGQ